MICEKLSSCYSDPTYACERKSDCLKQRDTRENVTCVEKKKRYNLINHERFETVVYHVDGGLIKDEQNTVKCDYLYGIGDPEKPSTIFIELKGTDLKHAIKQIKNSVMLFAPSFPGHRIYGRIVSGAVPNMQNDPAIQNLDKELRKRYNGKLSIFRNSVDERYSKLGD